MQDFVSGRNAVLAAIESGRPINKLLLLQQANSARDIVKIARDKRIIVEMVAKSVLNRIAGENHQGIVALVSPKDYIDIYALIEKIEAKRQENKKAFIIILDGIEDPQNLGAIIRTAEGAGVDAVVIPARRAAPLTAAVARASAGALEFINICRVTNINNTIDMLKENNVWVVGVEKEGQKSYNQADFSLDVAIVIGSEGSGISHLTKKKCDFLVNIPMQGKISSLNASASAAVVLYEVVRQRRARSLER